MNPYEPNNSSTQSPIRLQTHGYKQFYRFLHEEYTYINEEESQVEKSCILHSRIIPEKENYHMQIEMYRPTHRSSFLSESDKDLLFRLSQAANNLEFLVSKDGKIRGIQNLNKIRQKLKDITTRLSETYIGDKADKYFQFWVALYENFENLVIYYQQYAQLGLLFPPLQGGTRILPFYLIDQFQCLIEESIIQETVPEGYILKIQGKLNHLEEQDIYKNLSNMNGFTVKEGEFPILDVYDGRFELSKSGTLEKAHLHLMFIYGDNYKKIHNYELKSISHEEI